MTLQRAGPSRSAPSLHQDLMTSSAPRSKAPKTAPFNRMGVSFGRHAPRFVLTARPSLSAAS